MIITSASNQRLRNLRQAVRAGRGDDQGRVPIEGLKLLQEALRSHLQIEELFVSSRCRTETEALLDQAGGKPLEIVEVADRLFPSISSTETSQGVLALAKLPSAHIDELLRKQPLVLIGEGLQDPGNLGTLFRSAEAFGARGLILTSGSVSPRNPKVVRSSAGSVFRVPCPPAMEVAALPDLLSLHRFKLIAASPQAKTDFRDVNYEGNVALVVGNEGRGLSDELRKVALEIRVPTLPSVESLNVSVAASIILCEAARQRRR